MERGELKDSFCGGKGGAVRKFGGPWRRLVKKVRSHAGRVWRLEVEVESNLRRRGKKYVESVLDVRYAYVPS